MKHIKKSPLIIAHRGGAKSFFKKENTLDLFEAAIKQEIKMIEFDVRRTKDRQLVVFHDDSIDGQKISSLNYPDLALLARQSGLSVPLLKDALRICADQVMLDIELKESDYEEDVISLVEHYYSREHYVITSFLDSVIKKIKKLRPDIRAGLLIGKKGASIPERLSEIFPFRRLKHAKADFVVPHYLLVTPWLVRLCQRRKYNIYVWTVNEDAVFTKLVKKKVTAIITDYPERYMEYSH